MIQWAKSLLSCLCKVIPSLRSTKGLSFFFGCFVSLPMAKDMINSLEKMKLTCDSNIGGRSKGGNR